MNSNLELKVEEPNISEENIESKRETKFDIKKLQTQLEQTGFDIYMCFELLVFLLSFFFWVGESDDKDVRKSDSAYLYMFNSFLMIDFLFRMLSLKIESVVRNNWNHVLHCVLPLTMWLLAAFYKFDEVFGGDPIKVLNTILFAFMNFFVFLLLLSRFLDIDKVKEFIKKMKEKRNKTNDQNQDQEQEVEENAQIDVELGN